MKALRGVGLGALKLRDEPSAEAPTAMDVVRSEVHLLQTFTYVNFNVHSAQKHHALADEARFYVLRPEVSPALKALLEMFAADAFMYSRRHRNKFLPALGVCLGRFDGSPVRGAGMFEHVVATMNGAGLLEGKYAHLVGKAELKYVNYAAAPKGGGSEPEPDGAGS